MIVRCWSFNGSRKRSTETFLTAVAAFYRRHVTFNPYSIRSAPTVIWPAIFFWLAKRIQLQEIKHGVWKFHVQQGFPSWKHQKSQKGRKIEILSKPWIILFDRKETFAGKKLYYLFATCPGADVRGWTASEARGTEAGGATTTVHQGTRNIQIKVRENLGEGGYCTLLNAWQYVLFVV